MLGPGNARWLCLSLSFSHSPVLLILSRLYTLSPIRPSFPFQPRQRHYLCLSRFPCLPRSRVLLTRTRFCSPLSSIRAGLPAHRLTRRLTTARVAQREKGWRRKCEAIGGTGRTGPTHRSRDIHFHFIFLARYRRQRKKERNKEVAHTRGEESGKISTIPPRSVGFSIRFARVGIRDICNFTSMLERKSHDARIACALHSCDFCIGKEIMRGMRKK